MVGALAAHGPALALVAALWFVGTGLIAWAGNRARGTFAASLGWAGVAGVLGLVLVAGGAWTDTPAGVFAGAVGALMVWGWHELAFLTGAVTGPRRSPCPPGLQLPARFRAATQCVIHHELALFATALCLASLSLSAPNPAGAMVFGLLFLLRLSSKLALFFGAPSFDDKLLPAHLGYLKTYFGPPRLHPMMLAAALGACLLALALGLAVAAAPAGSTAAARWTILFGLAALGALEHLFLALPVRDGALWRWAIPARQN